MSNYNLRSFFEDNLFNKENTNTDELNIAVITILVSVSLSNCMASREEMNVLIEQVSNTFRLPNEECTNIINLVLPLAMNDEKMSEFIELINQKFSTDQKQMVMAMIWRIIEADGTTDEHESETARDVRNKLNLSFEQAVRARQISELEEHDFEKLKIKLTESAPLDPKTLR